MEEVELKQERSKWDIIHDMLKAIQEEDGAKKTHIMQRASLDWRLFKKYFKFLSEEGLIAKSTLEMHHGSGEYYVLPEKGRELLKKLKEVKGILNKKESFRSFNLHLLSDFCCVNGIYHIMCSYHVFLSYVLIT